MAAGAPGLADGRARTGRLMALSAGAVLAVYAAGYARTEPAARSIAAATARATAAVTGGGGPAAPAGGGGPGAPAPGASSSSSPASSGYRNGTYTATGYGMHGPITVAVVIAGGRIKSVAITACGTTFPCSYVSGLPAQVVAAQSAQVELVSGATFSSLAFQSAVEQALSQAGTAPAAGASSTAPSGSPRAPSSGYRNGTYTATGYGRHGPITVSVVVAANRVKSAAIAACGTTFSCSIISALPAEVVAAQSAQIDLVSGATDSSLAFQSAVQQALAEAQGQSAAAAVASAQYPGLGGYGGYGGDGGYRGDRHFRDGYGDGH